MKSPFEIPYPILRGLSWTLTKIGFSLKVQGQEHLEASTGPVILAGNHTGLLDTLVLMASCPRPFHFLMHEKVFDWAFVGKLVRYGNILVLNPEKPKAALSEAISVLKSGASVCIFPEGKLSADGQLNEFQEGAAFLQHQSQAVILPFAIEGGFEAWPHGQPWPKFLPISIAFGAPIVVDKHRSRSETTQLLKTTVSNLLVDLQERKQSCKVHPPLLASS